MAHSNENDYKLWGARFMACPDELMKYFNNSISIDKRMWREDIFVNLYFCILPYTI